MTILRSIFYSLFTILLFTCFACEDEKNFSESVFDEQEILERRKNIDEMFSDASNSPLPQDVISKFSGLHYYEPDEDYSVDAVFVPQSNPDTLTLLTTTSELRQAVKVGHFEFELNGKHLKLTAFQFLGTTGENTELFVPFKDQTNGVDTYGVGRYINIEMAENDSSYVLEFNNAYNPYCAYNEAYSCPLVPKENTLPVEVKAGEKKWK